VKSFEIDARSKIVSVRIGIHWSAGSSVGVESAYRSAWPMAAVFATTPCRAASSTAPG
jgi:hypothetical protein